MARTWTGLALACAALALASAAPAEAARAPARVTLVECTLGGGSDARSATFEAAMRAVPGTRRMRLRHTLYERTGDGVFRRIDAPGLGVWRRSRAGVRRFVFRQSVTALEPDAEYRVEVDFRWTGRGGTTLHRARRRSRTCRQPDPLPNLRVGSIAIAPGPDDGSAIYRVSVRNTGGGPVAGADVALVVDGRAPVRVALPDLAPLELVTVDVTAPRCVGFVAALADPDDRLRESDEHDNARSRRCR